MFSEFIKPEAFPYKLYAFAFKEWVRPLLGWSSAQWRPSTSRGCLAVAKEARWRPFLTSPALPALRDCSTMAGPSVCCHRSICSWGGQEHMSLRLLTSVYLFFTCQTLAPWYLVFKNTKKKKKKAFFTISPRLTWTQVPQQL